MKNRIITDIEQGMQGFLNNAQMKQLHEVLSHALYGVEIIKDCFCIDTEKMV